jgi:hypothetical protein
MITEIRRTDDQLVIVDGEEASRAAWLSTSKNYELNGPEAEA